MAKKIGNMTAIDKALTFYELLLFSQRAYSVLELRDILECSKSTVSRLVHTFEERKGVQFQRKVLDNCEWYSMGVPPRAPHLFLAKEDIDALAEGLALGREKMTPEQHRETSRLIDRLRAFFTFRGADEEQTSPCDARGRIDCKPELLNMAKLLLAIKEGRICRISSRKGDMATSERVLPLGFFTCGDALHVEYALLREEKEVSRRDVRLADISALVLTEETSEMEVPDGSRTFGVMPGTPFPVVANVGPSAADIVRERIYSDGQTIEEHPNGSLTLTFLARSQAEVVSWALSFGTDVEIVEPKELRSRIAEKIKAMGKLYRVDK